MPWTDISQYSSAKDAMISNGTSTAMKIHTALKYPEDSSEGKTFFEFLKDKVLSGNNLRINFTGHSLGGLMAPTLALWFYDMLGAPDLISFRDKVGINIYGFAGPTAGDSKFAEYSNNILMAPPAFRNFTRYINKNDVAVNVWDKDGMEKILSFYGDYLPISILLKIFVDILIVEVHNLEYKQPGYSVLTNSYLDKPDISDVYVVDPDAKHGLLDTFLLDALYKDKLADLGMSEEDIAQDREYTLLWLSMAIYQHVFPYLFSMLDSSDIEMIFSEIINPLINQIFPGSKIKGTLLKLIETTLKL